MIALAVIADAVLNHWIAIAMLLIFGGFGSLAAVSRTGHGVNWFLALFGAGCLIAAIVMMAQA